MKPHKQIEATGISYAQQHDHYVPSFFIMEGPLIIEGNHSFCHLFFYIPVCSDLDIRWWISKGTLLIITPPDMPQKITDHFWYVFKYVLPVSLDYFNDFFWPQVNMLSYSLVLSQIFCEFLKQWTYLQSLNGCFQRQLIKWKCNRS